jgi:hypothetical protein
MKPQLLQDFFAGFTPAFVLSTGNGVGAHHFISYTLAETIAALAVIP